MAARRRLSEDVAGGCAHSPHGSWARTRATANMRTHAPTHAHAQPRTRAATHTRSHAHTHRRSHAHTQPRTDAATHTRAYVRAHGGYRYRYWYGAGSRRQPSAEDEGRPLRFSLLAFYPFWRTSPPSVERRNGNVYALRTPSAGCCMLSATYGRLQLVRCMFLAARCLLHVVSMHRCSSSRPFCLVRVMHSMIPAARCLQHVVCCTVSAARSLLHAVRCMLSVTRCLPHVVCHTLCAARCLLRVDAARCALHAVCCMVCAARFRPPHISCIVSAVCCTLHAVFSCLPSVCVVRRMLRAGCCPLHDACCTLSAAACGLRRMFVCCCTYCRRALRRAMRCGVGQSGACCTVPPLGETAALRIACRPESHYSPEYCGSTIGCDCGVASRDCRRC